MPCVMREWFILVKDGSLKYLLMCCMHLIMRLQAANAVCMAAGLTLHPRLGAESGLCVLYHEMIFMTSIFV